VAIYDFACPACGRVYEVTRPMSKAKDPLPCAVDGTLCERVINVPGFTKSGPSSWRPSLMNDSASGSSSGWSHFGHSHGAGTSGHGHDTPETPSD
jgi:putative FmdB family regulatory protein